MGSLGLKMLFVVFGLGLVDLDVFLEKLVLLVADKCWHVSKMCTKKRQEVRLWLGLRLQYHWRSESH